jgi:hypothetical protein
LMQRDDVCPGHNYPDTGGLKGITLSKNYY